MIVNQATELLASLPNCVPLKVVIGWWLVAVLWVLCF
jgi:hypothetical protein